MAPDRTTVEPAARLRGDLRLPGDKSVSHRALILATMAAGRSHLLGVGDGADVRSTASIMGQLGARLERTASAPGTVDYRVDSPGVDGLAQPSTVLDCGNSGTSLRLIAGLLAGLDMTCTLDGDASLRARPVARVIEPLRAMGATLHAADRDTRPPLTVSGRHPLRAVDVATPVPSAQVKSAILLAALRADGRTTVRERVATRDHTERMFRARGIPVERVDGRDGWVHVSVDGARPMRAIDERVPGDVSAAAFWLVAGSVHPDAWLTLSGVGINPTRRAVIDLLRAMGAQIKEQAVGEPGAAVGFDVGEPLADLTVASAALRGIDIGPADVAAAIDEIPVLCLAASLAEGRTTIRGAGELRHKESDRIAGVAAGLRALGARIEVDGDDLTIDGRPTLHAALTDSLDDHRLAMTFAIAGLVASGPITIERSRSVAISYPSFFDDMERVRA